MMLIVLIGAVTFMVVAAFLWAARVRADGAERNASALAIYEDQLAELSRDAERGVITEEERNAAEIEVKRRMLRLGTSKQLMRRGSVAPILVAAVIVPIGAVLIYFQIGRPDLPSVPFAERQAETQELRDLTERLRTALATAPDGGDAEGWRLLSGTLTNQGDFSGALEAYRELVQREGANSVDFSRAAEASLVVNQGSSTPETRAWAERALELDPSNPAATYYLALVMSQNGRNSAGLDLLAERVGQEPAFAEWMTSYLDLGERLAAASGREVFPLPPARRGPSAEDLQAASEMSAEERAAMVEGMVEGLALRLQDAPEDVDGWLQLARAYAVLGRRDDAVAALQEVLARTEDDDPRRAIAHDGLTALE